MARSKLFMSLLVIASVCTLAATSFAKPKPCKFNGDYSFMFWSTDANIAGLGYFTVNLTAPACRSGLVAPGGILDCNRPEHGPDGEAPYEFEEFIDSGTVGIESDGEGHMSITGSTNDGICGTGYDTLVLDISVVQNGKTVLFNSNGEPDQAGNDEDMMITGRADKCFSGNISGCYDVRFWNTDLPNPDPEAEDPGEPFVGDCTVCVNGAGLVTGGSCACNLGFGNTETLSNIVGGFYAPSLDPCQSSTNFMEFYLASQPLCGVLDEVVLDYVVAKGGQQVYGACDYFNGFGCAFEGYLQ